MFNVYLGWDEREQENYDICYYSLRKHSGKNFPIYPLKQQVLRDAGIYTRAKDEKAATEFSLTRFLIPYLSGYQGYSIFIDSDNVITRDIREVFDYIHPFDYVSVVKHDYAPKPGLKMDGQVQHNYPRKNWSSFIVFNNTNNKALTLENVNTQSPSWLHRFSWIEDQYINGLPLEFNFLVGEYEKLDRLPINLHYTLGSPMFRDRPECVNCDYAEVWEQYKKELDESRNLS
jgi:hypothetical protein